jgi:hypothetical protein
VAVNVFGVKAAYASSVNGSGRRNSCVGLRLVSSYPIFRISAGAMGRVQVTDPVVPTVYELVPETIVQVVRLDVKTVNPWVASPSIQSFTRSSASWLSSAVGVSLALIRPRSWSDAVITSPMVAIGYT